MKVCCTAVLLILLVGCGTASRVVRLDTGQTAPLVFTPRSGARPVALGNGEFEDAVSELARDARPPTRPQEAARRLFEVEARSGSYTYETPTRRITPLKPGEYLEGQSTMAEVELTRDYLRWCERTGRPGDCLRLLTESPTVNGDGRFALAMALSKGAVLDEMLEAFKDMADPHAMVAAVLWTWTTYMVLVSIPDVTVSKGIAAVMTATIISYVGVDTFWGLVVGFKRLMDEAERATTFSQLRAAGERYGKLMGRNAARAFAMLAMAAIGNTAPGLATKVPELPGSMQAAVQAETQVGIRLAAVGEVEMVAVSAESVTIALAPGAVAMASRGGQGDGDGAAGWTRHGKQRANEARAGDTHRQVGDANRVIREGRKFVDSETGHTVHVSGDRVVITNKNGKIVTHFENSRSNTQSRIQSGKWVPKNE
ncbi:hypothetical protein CYFUS_005121 [Cystobacter fuscus]|uniref:Lipoprotein n=1 Tax=Cystobacter fuscus TaxID=43 RepID=A0A250J8Z9_9BACT|nr:hypothetical protein [Cystobacter fuscus]ATB39676.1 hypothetical protein CYFUS_005121 [Cystobacter fuscus]